MQWRRQADCSQSQLLAYASEACLEVSAEVLLVQDCADLHTVIHTFGAQLLYLLLLLRLTIVLPDSYPGYSCFKVSI